MKKLMIALAVAAFAVATQAASIQWKSGILYGASDAAGTVGSSALTTAGAVTAYIFELTADEYTSAQAMSTTELYDMYVTGGKSTTIPTQGSKTAQINATKTVADGSSTDPQKFYSLVIYEDKLTAASYADVDAFVKSALNESSWQDTTGVILTGLGGAKTTNWAAASAVPEPTSGIMLLLGVGLMALKRKRA